MPFKVIKRLFRQILREAFSTKDRYRALAYVLTHSYYNRSSKSCQEMMPMNSDGPFCSTFLFLFVPYLSASIMSYASYFPPTP